MLQRSLAGKGMAILLLTLLCFCAAGRAQDPGRFESEVRELTARTDSLWNPYRPAVVFTGSSSVRMWNSLQSDFPGYQMLNTGFGGSQASDLLHYLDTLILRYNPLRVAIYEGDNDLAEGKSPGRVLRDIREILGGIRKAYPGMPVVLIAAKPSISRWKLRGKYMRLNRKLERMAEKDPLLWYADVWNPMLQDGALDESLFIEDGLHMNADGYAIWKAVLEPLILTN